MPEDKRAWERYVQDELHAVKPLIHELGYLLAAEQPHLAGERYLMRAVTTESGSKLILLGTRASDGARVVMKATGDPAGRRELERERECRAVLARLRFAYQVFRSPEELAFVRRGRYLISVQRFIEQDMPFLERPLAEQFALALGAFKAQEGARATTYGHRRLIETAYDRRDAGAYLAAFDGFRDHVAHALPGDRRLGALLAGAFAYLSSGVRTIDQYGDFLTHTDFVPHNFRVRDGDIYLLDHSSLVFGNKYEGWARFLNFMALHNPPLERALVEYVRLNRAPEELESLKLMRVYRLGEIIWYYARTLGRSEGDLHDLNEARVRFWTELLDATLHDRPLDAAERTAYVMKRDFLRSPDEKKRQVGLL